MLKAQLRRLFNSAKPFALNNKVEFEFLAQSLYKNIESYNKVCCEGELTFQKLET